jgi:hypothetical protein
MPMTDPRTAPGPSRGVLTVATLVLCGAAVAIVYRVDRAYRRWVKRNHALVEQQARFNRARTTYRSKRASSAEVAGIVWALLEGFAEGADPPDRTRST